MQFYWCCALVSHKIACVCVCVCEWVRACAGVCGCLRALVCVFKNQLKQQPGTALAFTDSHESQYHRALSFLTWDWVINLLLNLLSQHLPALVLILFFCCSAHSACSPDCYTDCTKTAPTLTLKSFVSFATYVFRVQNFCAFKKNIKLEESDTVSGNISFVKCMESTVAYTAAQKLSSASSRGNPNPYYYWRYR